MKADKYGTATEQDRFRIGYQSPGKIVKYNHNRCHACRHGESTYRATFRCGLIKAAVARNATCNEWVQK